jgi:predicted 3-demethylubiquinone-9 3-methyltransferase (glyoxalase superfamily)
MAKIQKITPCLWFDGEAEPAAQFYTTIFPNSKIGSISRYGEAGREFHGKEPGTAMTVPFELDGQSFLGLNGGPMFKLSEAVSFMVNCDSQEEIDYFWEKLSAGGDEKAQQCGWLKDKFGLSWQVIPSTLPALMTDSDPAKSQKVMGALMQMKKLDIAALKRAKEE